MSDDQPTKPPTKLTISSRGTTVTIEATEPLAQVEAIAQRLHTEAHARCWPDLPAGFGGTL
ncbi:hypothetical protein [Micromonospora sp. NPDC048063]|uniref:hypothetical protein n=1 Tax=Micromonospora sp. NPDC048063 TaxID=3364256 RepID=UPI0037205114